jgi:tetratricopeptide (TPR) repeat protein
VRRELLISPAITNALLAGLCVAFSSGCSRTHPTFDLRVVTDREMPVSRLSAGMDLKIDIAEPGYRLISVTQEHADVQLHVSSPGMATSSFDAPSGRATRERACVLGQPGTLSIRLTTRDTVEGSRQSLRLVVATLAVDEPAGSPALEAECLESKGSTIHESSSESLRVSQAADYRHAATLWESLGDNARAADAHLNAAWLLARTSDAKEALAEGQNARAGYQRTHDSLGEARTLLVIAVARWALLETNTAESGVSVHKRTLIHSSIQRDLEKAVAIFDSAGSEFFAAEARNHLANSYYEQGRLTTSMLMFAEAAEHFRAAGALEGETRARANFNIVLYQAGSFRKAAMAFEELLDKQQGRAASEAMADILDSSAATHSAVGNYDKALPQFVQALQIHEQHEDLAGMARSLNGLAATYMRLGVPSAAIEYTNQARVVLRKRRNDAGPGSELVELTSELLNGSAQRQLGNFTAARSSHRTALQFAPNNKARLRAHLELLRDALAAKDIANARIEAEQTRQLINSGTELQSLQLEFESARVALLTGEQGAAYQLLKSLQGKFEAEGSSELEIELLQAMAELAFRRNNVEAALNWNLRALQLLHSQRLTVGSPDLRVQLTSLHRSAYELRVELLDSMRAGAGSAQRKAQLLAELFAASDDARAGLVQEVAQARTLVTDIVSNNALRDIAADIAFREHLLAAIDSGVMDESQRPALRAELARLRANADVRSAPLPATSVFRTSDYARDKVRNDTAILVFTPTSRGLRRYLLTRTEARELGAIELTPPVTQETLGSLLPAPEQLKPFRNLVIVSEPIIAGIPFAALAAGAQERPLVADHDITMALTLRDALRIAGLSDSRRRADLSLVALFYNPVFTPFDKRLGKAQSRTRSVAFSMFPELNGTSEEADAIAAHLGTSTLIRYSGFDAERSKALSEKVRHATVLHFATHAIASDAWPNGSGLMLSAFSKDGQPQNGFLSTLDLLSNRANTDLVVLSACETARGDAAANENVAGLARAFLGGGARRVVATLWKVDDTLSRELMSEFYGGLVAGKSPATALSAAQRVLATESASSGLPNWAAFVLYERAPDDQKVP